MLSAKAMPTQLTDLYLSFKEVNDQTTKKTHIENATKVPCSFVATFCMP